jgi:excisionase family DNA binding protein
VRVASGLSDLLTRHRTGLTEQDVVTALEAALSAAHDGGGAPLSDAEVEYLREYGGPGVSAALGDGSLTDLRRTSGEAAVDRVAQAISGSHSLEEAAHLLGVDRTRVSHRLRAGTLWSFTLGRHRRIPRWQLLPNGSLLPGLATIVPAIPAGIEPATVAAFMSTPQHDLGDESPSRFLASGGDPRVVAELVADLGRW